MARSIRNFWQHPKSCTLIVKQEKNLFGSVNFRCFHTRSSADVHSTRGAHKDLGRCQKCRDFLIRRMFFCSSRSFSFSSFMGSQRSLLEFGWQCTIRRIEKPFQLPDPDKQHQTNFHWRFGLHP